MAVEKKKETKVEKKSEPTLREKILKSKDIKSEIIDVEEWGVKVLVTSLNVTEREKVKQASNPEYDSNGKIVRLDTAKFQVAALIGGAKDPETKELIFKEEDVVGLLKKNVKAVDRVALRILDLSGMTPEAGEIKKRRFPEE